MRESEGESEGEICRERDRGREGEREESEREGDREREGERAGAIITSVGLYHFPTLEIRTPEMHPVTARKLFPGILEASKGNCDGECNKVAHLQIGLVIHSASNKRQTISRWAISRNGLRGYFEE